MQTWFAVATKPRSEALALDHLARQGFECLLPRVRRMLRGVAGIAPRVECMFPNYLFLRADPEQQSLAPVRSTRGALGLVRFGGVPAAVPAQAIERIRARLGEDGLVRLGAPTLRPGQALRIEDGPLGGFEGVFVREEGHDRVRVLLTLLGQPREVRVPRAQLGVRL